MISEKYSVTYNGAWYTYLLHTEWESYPKAPIPRSRYGKGIFTANK